ncbi:MAG: PDGLE domain-containing protein [Bacillota bacterium]
MLKNNTVRIGLLCAIIIAGILSPFASSFPDGLERVAEDLGFIEFAQDNPLPAPVPDYTAPWISHEGAATGIAGIIGVFVTYSFMMVISKGIAAKKHDLIKTNE